MKTKLITVLLVLALAFSLSACAEGSCSAGSEELQAFTSLQLECAAAGVRIVHGDRYAISWNVQGTLSVEAEGDTLTVTQHRPRAKYEDTDNYITVTLPQKAALKSVSLSSAAGEVVMEGIGADSLRIVCAAGSVQLRDVAVSEAEISVSAGELFYSGSLGNAEIVVSAGDAELQLAGDPAAYYIDANVAVGHLWADAGTVYSADEAQYVVKADVAMGDFKLLFS